ncbi:thioredoxin-like protein [Lasiosphaeria hispida]|uniref:Thioredoxin-like protein n=1 Tax=Lasiosphaeria hispida TaxID=260671 RepID=A0AAJ0H613_9PEZI|nr:thioredoxin-like protein [Lasiosphaeria hispida]
METLSWVCLVFLIFLIGRALLMDRSPIPETSGRVYKVANKAEFDAVLSANNYVVVDFYADWCPPCRAIAPIFSGLADNNSINGHLAFAKVNVDHVKDVAGRYGVSAMPTFLFFHNGAPKGVAVESLEGRPSVGFTDEGLVDRVRGADRAALEAVVKALAGK